MTKLRLNLIFVAVAGTLVTVLVAIGCLAFYLFTGPMHPVRDVEIFDDAQILDSTLVKRELSRVNTFKDTRVIVWTRNGSPQDNINAETLNWARQHQDLNLMSGPAWSNGTFIITVSVEDNSTRGSGQVGTYFGEDIKIASAEAQTELREPGYQYFKQRNWSQGVVAITEANARRMARPAVRNPTVLQGIALAVAVFSVVNFVSAFRRVRRFESDAKVFDAVTVNVNERVAATDFILDEGFGAKIHNAAATLLRNYTDALDLRDSIKSTSFFALNVLNRPLKKRIDAFSDKTDQIENATDMVDRATALYSRDEQNWQAVWKQEIDDTRSHLKTVLSDRTLATKADSSLYQSLCEFAKEGIQKLDQIEYGVSYDDGTNTSAYLDQIARIREELTSRMNNIQEDVLLRSGKQKRFIQEATERSLRSNRARSHSLTGYFDTRSFYAPAAFATGYNNGLRDYESYKESRSSGGSGGTTTGYGSSGGGFSGAGSSSRF